MFAARVNRKIGECRFQMPMCGIGSSRRASAPGRGLTMVAAQDYARRRAGEPFSWLIVHVGGERQRSVDDDLFTQRGRDNVVRATKRTEHTLLNERPDRFEPDCVREC